MAYKDFSILLEKIDTAKTKKDVSLVSGFNAITQYIENVLKTQKGELISNMNMGTDYFTYSFGTTDPGSLEFSLESYIQSAIPKISNVKVTLRSQSKTSLSFQVTFSIFDGIRSQNNATCFIEVET
jgi:phage baseplate assembly protein W